MKPYSVYHAVLASDYFAITIIYVFVLSVVLSV